ncbi:hypothetical protein FQA39_LY04063 [Lamprigera yunnana]|nr:hypothetical protein FQA39_LY04063 [Lamprigera yunnana]
MGKEDVEGSLKEELQKRVVSGNEGQNRSNVTLGRPKYHPSRLGHVERMWEASVERGTTCRRKRENLRIEEMQDKVRTKQEYFKRNYDKSANKFNQTLKPGDNVLIEDKFWEKGKVVDKHCTPRSFNVINNKGNIIRRNFSQLKPTNTKFEIDNSSDPDDYDQDQIKDCSSSSNSNLIENNHNNDNNRITHSGRVVKLPTRFKDYVL